MSQLIRPRPPDRRVLRYLELTSRQRKALIQHKLFIDQHKGSGHLIDNGIIPPLLGRELQAVMATRRSSEAIGMPTARFLPPNVTELKIRLSKSVLVRQYTDWVIDNAISFIVEDISETTTDVNYDNLVHSCGVESLNVVSGYLADVTALDDIPCDSKLISIPSSRLDTALTALSTFQEHRHDYPIDTVLLNLTRAPQVAKEVLQLLQGKQQTADALNYDSLLQIAKETRPDSQNFTRKFLSELSYAQFLDVQHTEIQGSSFLVFRRN